MFTLDGLPAVYPEGSVPNSNINDSEPSAKSSSVAVNVSVPDNEPLAISILLLSDKLKSATTAVGLPEVLIRTGIDTFAVAANASVAVTVSVPQQALVVVATEGIVDGLG